MPSEPVAIVVPDREEDPPMRMYRASCGLLIGLAIFAIRSDSLVAAAKAPADDQLAKVRTKRFAIHYEASAAQLSSVELWFTQDEGETWHNYGADSDPCSPFEFIAPTEGTYGFYLILTSEAVASTDPPSSGTAPQTWAFVDYTPPLLQLHFARFDADDPSARRVAIRWTAFDRFPEKRPISITFRREGEDFWLPVIGPMPNVGRYDWTPPPTLAGRISIKLAMLDRAGNLVERTTAPLDVPEPRPAAEKLASTRPATPSIPPPAVRATRGPDTESTAQGDPSYSHRTQELYELAGHHLLRGEYAIATERLKEILAVDPSHRKARYELAGLQLLQKNYDLAIGGYKALTNDFPDNRDARYGLALAYWSKKQYALARDELEQILGDNQDDVTARLKLGDVYWQLGDGIRARQNWTAVQQHKNAGGDMAGKAASRLRSFPLGAGP